VSYLERSFVLKALKDFLDYWKTRDNPLEVRQRFQTEAASLPEHLDPDRGVNQIHAISCRAPFVSAGPLSFETEILSSDLNRQLRESVAP
jgi:hypothetical protein